MPNPFQGPLVVDQTGSSSGTTLDAAHLNSLVVTQVSYLQNGSVPVTATNTNPPIVTQPQVTYAINSGTAASWHSITTVTSLTIPSSGTSQDVYCDVDDTEAFTLYAGPVGFTAPSPAANALRLWKVTTGTANVGVSGPFINLANPYPLGAASFMAIDGSNAVAVSFPSTLSVAGMTTLAGGAVVSGGIFRIINQPASVITKGSGLSSTSVVTQINGGSQYGVIRSQILGSNSNPALAAIHVVLNTQGLTPIGVLVTADSGATAWATIPSGSGSSWSFDIFTQAALTTTTSIYNFQYEVLYQ